MSKRLRVITFFGILGMMFVPSLLHIDDRISMWGFVVGYGLMAILLVPAASRAR